MVKSFNFLIPLEIRLERNKLEIPFSEIPCNVPPYLGHNVYRYVTSKLITRKVVNM